MFSNDKNIERIADLIEESKNWLLIRKEYTKLEIIDKVVQLCTALALTIVLAFLIVLILVCLSFSAAYAIVYFTGSLATAFLLIGFIYIIVLLLIVAKRHTWIERPFVKFLVNILLDDENTDGKN